MLETLARYLPLPARFRPRRRSPSGTAFEAPAELQRKVAEGMFKQTLARGGWAADLGGFGADWYLDDASACIQAIALGNAEGGPPTP